MATGLDGLMNLMGFASSQGGILPPASKGHGSKIGGFSRVYLEWLQKNQEEKRRREGDNYLLMAVKGLLMWAMQQEQKKMAAQREEDMLLYSVLPPELWDSVEKLNNPKRGE